MTENKNQNQNNSTSSENKSSLGENDWKAKFQDLVQSCQTELKRTTQIGLKMLSASQSNAQLHECYEELGRLARKECDSGVLQWNNIEAKDLMEKIAKLEEDLESFEDEVQRIKKN